MNLEIPSYGISARRPFDDGSFINNRTDCTPVHEPAKSVGDAAVLRAALAREAELAAAGIVKELAVRQ